MPEPTGQAAGGGGKNVLLYACSGAANVAEAADRACRQLSAEKCGAMFCLAAIGADIEPMAQTARDADLNVLVDGCDMDCAKKIFERVGIGNFVQIKVTDLDIQKSAGRPATDEEVAVIVKRIKEKVASK